MKWGHDQLAEDLAAHLRGSTDRMVWTDMQLGPAGSSRPDVYAIPISYSRFQPVAYECKVSMPDFRADVTKGKYTDYLKFAAGVVFACPAGLLKKEDIPPGAGLMVRGPDGWRSLKKAALTKCESLPRDTWMKLLIDGGRREIQRQELEKDRVCRSLKEYQALQKIRAEFGDVVSAAIQDHRNQTTHRLANLKGRVADQTARLQADLDRLEQERQRVRARVDSQCTGMLNDLAALVGMDPDPDEIYEMGRRLRTMIQLAGESSAVKAMYDAINGARHAFDEVRRIEGVVTAANGGNPPA